MSEKLGIQLVILKSRKQGLGLGQFRLAIYIHKGGIVAVRLKSFLKTLETYKKLVSFILIILNWRLILFQNYISICIAE